MSREKFIQYESLARAEADDIIGCLPTELKDLTSQQVSALLEILAHSYAVGLQAGFDMSDFGGQNPATDMEIYNAGIAEGRKG